MTNDEKILDLQRRIADAFHGKSTESIRDLVAELQACDRSAEKALLQAEGAR